MAIALGALWLMSSRTRKQQKMAQEFRNNLVPGDEVMTASGLLGTVVAVEDDVITLESSPGAHTRWIRAAIAKKIEPPVEEIDDETDEVDELADEDTVVTDADRISRANDDVIDVPDDLSTLPPVRKDGEPDTK
ncbi:preprotein translocase subunit YajC [Cellulomonas sp. zg-ZUI188]|uniref:Preprotein translocase subunit YajC n=2 Tax=Cellulomonas fengjieae TaxID=2819978 RepID=A0ABS3SID0_9CELL|nr:preprotein translocase subunit YajC [Cellulomonas fengjieae]MBO3102608.1 preprotein translocase subunit YajC [Cellulomonas fengjieae]QVI67881.1 preprotein translocase subunit YajC [Cellulomonas fengjieae]